LIIRTDTFIIRPLRDDDLLPVLEVYRQCEDFLARTPKPTASMEIVQEDLALSRQNGGIFCGIYNHTGTMMGILDVVLSGFEGERGSAFIELLMIGQPYRQRGLGSAVVQALETYIQRDTHVNVILAAVMVNNPVAIRFWERHGYKIVGGPEAEPDGTTVWKLSKLVISRS